MCGWVRRGERGIGVRRGGGNGLGELGGFDVGSSLLSPFELMFELVCWCTLKTIV